MVVSSVQIRPFFSLMWPKPRATLVSKLIQPSSRPSASTASSPSAIAQPEGLVTSSWLVQHVADLVLAFERPDVPGEGHEVAPVAVVQKQACRGFDVARCERAAEAVKEFG